MIRTLLDLKHTVDTSHERVTAKLLLLSVRPSNDEGLEPVRIAESEVNAQVRLRGVSRASLDPARERVALTIGGRGNLNACANGVTVAACPRDQLHPQPIPGVLNMIQVNRWLRIVVVHHDIEQPVRVQIRDGNTARVLNRVASKRSGDIGELTWPNALEK